MHVPFSPNSLLLGLILLQKGLVSGLAFLRLLSRFFSLVHWLDDFFSPIYHLSPLYLATCFSLGALGGMSFLFSCSLSRACLPVSFSSLNAFGRIFPRK